MKTWDILGLGCVAVDDLLYLPSFPVADAKVRVLKRERQCGGLTGTALVTAARLGARCAFAGLLGTDELSLVVEDNFLHEGVEVSFAPHCKDAPVPHSVIIVGINTGSRNIFYRIEGRVGADDGLPDESIIRSARVLFLDQYGMVGNLRAASIARAAGIPIVADFEEDCDPRFPELLKLVDHIVLPNDLAQKITAEKSPEAAAEALWHKERHGRISNRYCLQETLRRLSIPRVERSERLPCLGRRSAFSWRATPVAVALESLPLGACEALRTVGWKRVL
jgi:sulfofructose kinase